MKPKIILTDEKGSILVIALVMLALLTTLGIMSTNTTSIDLQIARNERIQKENFNLAEAANMQAVQKVIDDVQSITAWSEDPQDDWIIDCDEDDDVCVPCNSETCEFDDHPYRDIDFWFTDAANTVPRSEVLTKTLNINGQDHTLYYAVEFNGIAPGTSEVDPTEETLQQFTCYGLYNDPNRGQVIIETSMTLRFTQTPS